MRKHFQQNKKGWVVKNTRPEEEYEGKAGDYYNKEVSTNYAKSKAMQKMQEEITRRAIELAGLKKGRVLDIGAGTGYSMKVLKKEGIKPTGIDASEKMIKQAEKEGIKIKKADMRNLPFKEKQFDGAVSISALQWLLTGTKKEKKENIEKVARETNRVLKPGGKAVFQFYPKTEEEAYLVGKEFAKKGFKGQVVTDYPDNPRKRKVYLVLEKE